jgi:hypothetical protein
MPIVSTIFDAISAWAQTSSSSATAQQPLSSAVQTNQLILLKAILSEVSWRSSIINQRSLTLLLQIIPSASTQLCQAIGECFSVIFLNLWRPRSLLHAPESNSILSNALAALLSGVNVECQRASISADQWAHSRTFLRLLNYSYTNGFGHTLTAFLPLLLMPLFATQESTQEDIRRSAMANAALISQTSLTDLTTTTTENTTLNNVIIQLKSINQSTNWHIRASVLPFLQ